MRKRILSIQPFVLLTLIVQIILFGISSAETLFPETDRWISISTTCAQIVCGMYGITLAGYTFFISHMDSLSDSDRTLDYIVSNIKKRFKYLIITLTFNVFIVLIASVFIVYIKAPDNEELLFFYRLFCNEFIAALFFSMILMLFYSAWIIDPKCIEKEAAKLKKKLSPPAGTCGDAARFLALYSAIDDCCNKKLPQEVLLPIAKYKKISFDDTLKLLLLQNLLTDALASDLTRLHRYYACTLNCSPIDVTQEMYELAEKTLKELSA